jgi:hypothetical protein
MAPNTSTSLQTTLAADACNNNNNNNASTTETNTLCFIMRYVDLYIHSPIRLHGVVKHRDNFTLYYNTVSSLLKVLLWYCKQGD